MSRRTPRLSGWSRPESAESGWRRKRDLIGFHTFAGVLLGVAIPVSIAFLSGAIKLDDRVPNLRNDPVKLEEQYSDVWAEAMERENSRAYAERLGELLIDEGLGGEQPWAVGFRAGWGAGRQDAATAMRVAAEEQQLGEHRIEWIVLNRIDPPEGQR